MPLLDDSFFLHAVDKRFPSGGIQPVQGIFAPAAPNQQFAQVAFVAAVQHRV